MTGPVGRNFADVWEVVADTLPDTVAQVQGSRVSTWCEFDARADGLGRALLAVGLGHQDKVAIYLYNCPEYLETVYATFKVAMVPVNTNYRYAADELAYLWENSDAVAVVFHGEFSATVDVVRDRLPGMRLWLWVDDGSGPCPPWATRYEEALARRADGRAVPPWGRSADDVFMLYTGGTTGMPKGVMWRQDDLFNLVNEGGKVRFPVDMPLDDLATLYTLPGPRFVPACPLMHGTGAFGAFSALSSGGSVISLEGRRFDPIELLDTIERHAVQSMAIVGDAFALPILRELDRASTRWDISSLRFVVSSGVMWSQGSKERLLAYNPRLLLLDSLGSSEAVGLGASVMRRDDGERPITGSFKAGPSTAVISDDGRFVAPGSDEMGMLALRGRVPLGYYKDPVKSAATFRLIDGIRWSIPGDYARIDADGSIVLLGRGSVCVNTGGEKVFPEEVEERLKELDEIEDAVVVGIPDARFGEAVAAVVQLAPGAEIDDATITSRVKERLAAYKAPRHLVRVPSLQRAPNGKVDYARWQRHAMEQVG